MPPPVAWRREWNGDGTSPKSHTCPVAHAPGPESSPSSVQDLEACSFGYDLTVNPHIYDRW